MNRVVFFDVDNVLIRGQTQELVVKFLFKKKKINLFLLIKLCVWFFLYKFNIIHDVVRIRKKALRILAGWDVLEGKLFFEEFFQKEIKPRVFSESVAIIQQHIREGREIILVSASLDEIVGRLRDFLGLKYEISVNLEKINGKYTGKSIGIIPYGVNKVKVIEYLIKNNGLTLEGSYAYADHFSDLDLLEIVTYPAVVNPDRNLRKIAVSREWRVYDFL